MAVFTAAALAVGAAIATTTAATVATAVVAVSAAVGVAGLAVGAVGMAIGNEDLMFAGKVMGYVGLAGGLAGGVIGGLGASLGSTGATFAQGFGDAFAGASQHLSTAWDKGVGSWFAGGDKITGTVGGAVDDVAAGGMKSVPTGASSSPNGQMAAFPEVTTPGKSIVMPGDGVSVGTKALAPSAPVTSGVAVPNAPTTMAGMNTPSVWTPSAGAAPGAGGGGMMSSVTDTLANTPDWMKYSMMTTGAQGITGMASGYFQGETAEQQLEAQKVNAQRDEAQRQHLNTQANQVPLIQFAKRY